MRILATIIMMTLWACQAPPAAPPEMAAEEGQDPEEGDAGEKPVTELPGTKPPIVTPPDPGEGEEEQPPPSRIVVSAQMVTDMCAAGPKSVKTQTITIPARTTGCSFGVNGNGAQKENYIVARETDSAEMGLTKDMMICDLTIQSTSDELTHQDEAFYMLDKFIIGTDYGAMTKYFTEENGMLVWDFTKIKDKVRDITPGTYCLGGAAKCDMPERLITDQLQFSLSNAEIGSLALSMLEKEKLRFDLVVIGGGSSSDCTHDEPYELNITIDYVTNPNYK